MIEIKNLSVKTTDGKEILDNFSLNLSSGETHAIMGPNGTGKSTLSKILMGSEDYIVTSGDILVDGLGVGDVGNIVLRDRQHLAEDGIMIVVLALDQASGYLVSGPDIVSRGFVYVKESDELMDEARERMTEVIENCLDRGITDWGKIKNSIKDSLGDYVWKKTKRRPMILPIILEV